MIEYLAVSIVAVAFFLLGALIFGMMMNDRDSFAEKPMVNYSCKPTVNRCYGCKLPSCVGCDYEKLRVRWLGEK